MRLPRPPGAGRLLESGAGLRVRGDGGAGGPAARHQRLVRPGAQPAPLPLQRTVLRVFQRGPPAGRSVRGAGGVRRRGRGAVLRGEAPGPHGHRGPPQPPHHRLAHRAGPAGNLPAAL